MSGPYQLPPILNGSAEQQLRQLRDYLVRLARELPGRGDESQVTLAVKQATAISAKQNKESVEQTMQRAQQLKALIRKTADEIYVVTDKIETTLHSDYVAISEYGDYYETIENKVETTAKNTVESYQYEEGVTLIDKLGDLDEEAEDLLGRTGVLERYITKIDAQIRRGFIPNPEHSTDPGAPEHIFGIAISQKLQFIENADPVTNPDDNLSYDPLVTQQTFGFYTSTGWQFWIGGQKVGWFDSRESGGVLHVSTIIVESRLQLGDDWEITTSGGFGLRYIGS